MEQQVIEVEKRAATGKGAARKFRAAGKIPGILYGHKEAPTPFVVDPHELRKRVRSSGLGRNTVFVVEGLGRRVLALLKNTQVDPVRHDLVHIDLVEVRESDVVTVDVPIELTGKPAGVVLGGELEIVRRSLQLRCSPLNIPRAIIGDVTPLQLGHTLHASDITVPEGSELADSGKLAIATVKMPRAEEAPAAAAEVPEGAEAAAAVAATPAT